ncbi:hypothetical protein SAMN05444972_110130 [Marininema halotolerans]|uniref:Uncharacterized protein n=1 Tax=Marininema halotolerans TaxID=1155944 RepID=A0A1I6TMT4_9BACL|nr:hypothetical protein SAMN05444972_110130 [Marininema halotolerans]
MGRKIRFVLYILVLLLGIDLIIDGEPGSIYLGIVTVIMIVVTFYNDWKKRG